MVQLSKTEKNEIRYRLIQTAVDKITVYGIEVSQSIKGNEYRIQAAYVSTNKSQAQALMETLERCGVGVITFREVMEDYIIDRVKNSIKRL